MAEYSTAEIREGFVDTSSRNPHMPEHLGEVFDRWLAGVIAGEREACALIAQQYYDGANRDKVDEAESDDYAMGVEQGLLDASEAIRNDIRAR